MGNRTWLEDIQLALDTIREDCKAESTEKLNAAIGMFADIENFLQLEVNERQFIEDGHEMLFHILQNIRKQGRSCPFPDTISAKVREVINKAGKEVREIVEGEK